MFCEAAVIEIKRDLVFPADDTHLSNVLHGDWLTPARIISYRQHYEGNMITANATDQLLERAHIHVALEWVICARVAPFCYHQVNRFGADEFNVGASRIEVRIVRYYITLFTGHTEENSLGGASLVRGNHVTIAENILH